MHQGADEDDSQPYYEDKYKQDCQLQNLEKLKLVMRPDSIKPVLFPEMLRKLTLETVGALPNLEVRDHACQGDTWVSIEGHIGLAY